MNGDFVMAMRNVSRRTLMLGVAAFGAVSHIASASANPDFDLGPPVNAKLPDLGMPLDQTGKPRTLASLMGEKGLVLFFIRSVVWCPFCQAQLNELSGGLKQIEARGYKMAGISYEKSEVQKEYAERKKIGFTLLADPGSIVIDRYKLRDPQYPMGDFAYGVPRPIIFILDKNGVVKAKLYEDTYTKRPPLKVVLETLDKVNKGAA
jgi:peroxiredoxin